MNTIKGRIMAGFLVLIIILSPFLFTLFQSLRKINTSKNLREKVAIFNVNQLKAFSSFTKAWDFDSRKDSFYINESSLNTKAFFERIDYSKKTAEDIRALASDDKTTIHEYTHQLDNDINQLEQLVKKVLALQLTRGFKDYGLEGEMRKKIHRLESETHGISLAEVLSLRRREKDYFLRNELTYVQKLNSECNLIKTRLKRNQTENKNTLAILSDYQDIFNRIVELENRIGNENQGIIEQINEKNRLLGNTASDLYYVITNDSNMTVQNAKFYVILVFALTLIFAFTFAYFFSNHITRPIKILINNMQKIAKKSFSGEKMLKSDIHLLEINQLTQTYNNLIEKIRSQIEILNQKNYELNRVNFKLIESENELKETSKLKDKFFSIISHDLRNHTGNVLSLAQVLNSGDAISNEQKSVFTKYLMDSSQNLQLLLDNLLNWAKSQMNDHDMSKRSFEISTLIQNNIILFNENAKRKGVEIHYQKSSLTKAYADKDMIDFVIRNLLSNALKFTSDGDSIKFTIEEVNDMLKIHIKDTGVGMTPEQVNTLLYTVGESFTTMGTSNEKGSGLGLSICKDFITKNGGEIEITSEKGKGTTFTFSIPTSLTKETILVNQ